MLNNVLSSLGNADNKKSTGINQCFFLYQVLSVSLTVAFVTASLISFSRT